MICKRGMIGRQGRRALAAVFAAVLLGAGGPAAADDSLSDGARATGRVIGHAVREIVDGASEIGGRIGRDAARFGKAVGHAAADAGRAIGRAAREGGRAFGRAMRDDDQAEHF
ncbi:MAG: hypothetical protein KDH15_12470 [Rhodocyclaceae bacterium]|nr:hypothetical protein [Rhodocyclaceae bacterium]